MGSFFKARFGFFSSQPRDSGALCFTCQSSKMREKKMVPDGTPFGRLFCLDHTYADSTFFLASYTLYAYFTRFSLRSTWYLVGWFRASSWFHFFFLGFMHDLNPVFIFEWLEKVVFYDHCRKESYIMRVTPGVEVVSGLVPAKSFRAEQPVPRGGWLRGFKAGKWEGGALQNKHSWRALLTEKHEAWWPSAGLSAARGTYTLKKRLRSWRPHTRCSGSRKRCCTVIQA